MNAQRYAPSAQLDQPGPDPVRHSGHPVTVLVGPVHLGGELAIPHSAAGMVVFAHGSGSSRHSPRNQFVASELRRAGLGTLLLDLLTPDEARADEVTGGLRFDVHLLADRLTGAVRWLEARDLLDRPVGFFGASTGAAAALVAAARHPQRVTAVVSRGGRPDLAGDELGKVAAPTLLLVGGRDVEVLELNRQAARLMHAEVRLEVVAGATHLFPEAGALGEVARLATDWFAAHLQTASEAKSRP